MKAEEWQKLQGILWKHKKVLRKQPGRLTSYEHFLKVREDKPFVSQSYPIPIAYREEVDEEIQSLLKVEIIQRSNSLYIDPLALVLKHSNT